MLEKEHSKKKVVDGDETVNITVSTEDSRAKAGKTTKRGKSRRGGKKSNSSSKLKVEDDDSQDKDKQSRQAAMYQEHIKLLKEKQVQQQ